MNMKEWAANEIKIACKRENPNWDGKSFDYGCACYQSALKAYNSLCDDDHSGFSFNLTKNILIKLMNNLPLTSITEDDFKNVENYINEKALKKEGIKSIKQCPRMSSLFRTETIDGKIYYNDVDRSYSINIHDKYDTFTGFPCKIIDKLFPITLPYGGNVNKYKIYVEQFLSNKDNGDFDTIGILYCITPDNKKIEINKYYTEKDNEFIEIDKGYYDKLKDNKVYPFKDE